MTIATADTDINIIESSGNYIQQSENDIALDSTGQNIYFLTGRESILRRVKHAVQTRAFELQLNMNKGVPYFETIFNSAYLALWMSYMTQTILAVDGIISIDYFTPQYDSATKVLSFTCGVITTEGSGVVSGNV